MNEKDMFYLKLNRTIAYTGQIGLQRENFCNNYMLKKQEIFKGLFKKQEEIASYKSETISCGKSCSHCCMLMVSASIQEVELIVHYLYKNEELFNSFIKIYPLWISKIRGIGSLLKEPSEPDNQSVNDVPIEKEPEYDVFSNRSIFAEQKLYCPFLCNGICSIYEVRPFFCAGYIATTPSEWCNPLHPDHNRKRTNQTFNVNLAKDLSFLFRKSGKAGLVFYAYNGL